MAITTTYDPCARLATLRNALDELLTGQRLMRARDNTASGDREVAFANARPEDLRVEIRRLEIECAAAQGQSTARSIRVGPTSIPGFDRRNRYR
ncbi:hypothetical protein E8L99_16525 [Phreatobacter aquaticus]|uniref:Uncharacterized protein n=1 Tax=Phreatobacter aquaticus TaxID=2570229 RepID=A0A4D7QQS0_9HYPH|nr:gpW family head-tail joining protein [Phreatobacter aquaticus]QCK87247.1 hypothetical protein E8L99_16525 [Phreatobacter aquaticus]